MIGPSVPEDDLSIYLLELRQIGTGGIEHRADLRNILLPIREIVMPVVPMRIAENEVLVKVDGELGAGGQPVWPNHPSLPATRIVLATVGKARKDPSAVDDRCIVDCLDRGELFRRHAGTVHCF